MNKIYRPIRNIAQRIWITTKEHLTDKGGASSFFFGLGGGHGCSACRYRSRVGP